jgi:hypothetical protein
MTAWEILEAAGSHMRDRAATYDSPAGERSMGSTVAMFNTLVGQDMTEEQGWLFMALLKMVRSQQGDFKSDNFEDLCAYGALAAEEAVIAHEKRAWTHTRTARPTLPSPARQRRRVAAKRRRRPVLSARPFCRTRRCSCE